MNNIPNQPTFSIRKALSYGFKTYFKNIWLLLGCFLIFIGIMIVTSVGVNLILPASFIFNVPLTSMIPFFFSNLVPASLILCLSLIQWLIAQWLAAGFLKLSLEIHDTGASSIKTLFSCTHALPYFIVTSLLYSLMITIGMICFIIPGFYCMVRYHFAIWSVVDEHAWIIDGFKYSSKLTCGIRFKLFLYMLAFIAISIIPIFIPVGILGIAYIYRWTQHNQNNK